MAFSPYLHGVEISEEASGSLPIQTIRTAVIGLIGTSQKGEAGKLQLITSPREAAEAFGSLSDLTKKIEQVEDNLRKLDLKETKTDQDNTDIARLKADLAIAKANLANPKLYTLEKSFEAIYLQGSPLIVAMTVGSGIGASQTEKAYQLKDAADNAVAVTINGKDSYSVAASDLYTEYTLTVDPKQKGTTYDLEVYVDANNKSTISRIADEEPELKTLMDDLVTDLNALAIGSIKLNAMRKGNVIKLKPSGELVVSQVSRDGYHPIAVDINTKSVYTVLADKINAAAKSYSARATTTRIFVAGAESLLSDDLSDVTSGAQTEADDKTDDIRGSVGDQTGVYAFLAAQSELGFTPKIILAPAYGDSVDVQAAMLSVAEKLRAVALFEAPETATFNDALKLGDAYSSSRVYLSFPWVEGTGDIGTVPMSAFIAGTIARNDLENGFWASPSNKVMNGIKALKQKVSWSISDPNSQANLLNEKGIATAIREGGFRLWGSRTLGKNSKLDSANVFINVRRTTDTINDSVVRANLWAVDKGITVNFVQDVLEAINNFLRNLRSQGAIINGLAFVDPKDNTPDQIKQGKVVFSFDYTAVYPAEQIKFKSIITDKYLTEVFE